MNANDKINFIWEMTEDDLLRLYNPEGTNNYCGGVYFGDCKCEFVYEPIDQIHYISFTNLYVLDDDQGYATLADGTPYGLHDDCILLPPRECFSGLQDFQKLCERLITSAMHKEKSYLLQKAIGETRIDTWHQPIRC